jgi:DNA-binding TFAR19-related protein (PDSD5 family)
MPSDYAQDYEEDENSQKRLKKRVSAALRNMQIEQEKKELLKQLLDAKAYERMMNIRISNPAFYTQIVNIIISLVQTNRINGKMNESQLLSILDRITSKKETKIEYKHK